MNSLQETQIEAKSGAAVSSIPLVRRHRVQFFCKVGIWWRPCSEWVNASTVEEAINKALALTPDGMQTAGPFKVDSEAEPTPTWI